MTTLYLPNFRPALSQLASGINPELATATTALNSWVSTYCKASPGKWDKAPTFCLGAAMSYPDTDVERLRIAAEWVTVIFVWDDILDVPDSRLVHDGKGAGEIQRIMMRVLTAPEGDVGVETTFAFVEYCLQIDVPDTAYYHPVMQQMQQMRDAVNDILSLANVRVAI